MAGGVCILRASSRDWQSSVRSCRIGEKPSTCPLLLTGHSQTAEQVRARGGWRQGVCSCAWFLFSVFQSCPRSHQNQGAGNVQRPHEILSSRLALGGKRRVTVLPPCPGPPVLESSAGAMISASESVLSCPLGRHTLRWPVWGNPEAAFQENAGRLVS